MNDQPTIKEPATRPCPICGHRRGEVLHRQRFTVPEDYLLPAAYDVVSCLQCGFVYADTAATQQDYDRYYARSSKYEDNQTATGGGQCDWDRNRLRTTAKVIAETVPDRGAKIADIGCANGGLLGELKEIGFHHLLGIDPSPACVANVRSSQGIEAVHGSFRELPPGLGKFDLVILSHVLEHVADLQGTVSDLIPLLHPSGMLYIEVPDASRYAEFLISPFQDFNTEHINHFGPDSLRNLFEGRGFVLEAHGQKEVESSAGCPYPALFGFFRFQPESSRTDRISFKPNPQFRAQLLDYIAASREKIAAIEARLAGQEAGSFGLIVWGTGQLTMKLLAETSLAKTNILAFVDGNPINQGKRLLGRPIIAPEEIEDRAAPILIATLLHQDEITERIRGPLALPNPIITLNG